MVCEGRVWVRPVGMMGQWWWAAGRLGVIVRTATVGLKGWHKAERPSEEL